MLEMVLVLQIYLISFKRNKRHLWKKQLTKEEIKNYKVTESEIYKKFASLSEDELNEISSKNVYVKNVMTNIIKHCRGEKKKEV